MLEPIKKMPRITEDGDGIYYYIDTGEKVDILPTPQDDADKTDEIIDRVNLLSELENKRKANNE